MEIERTYRMPFDGGWDSAEVRRVLMGARRIVLVAHTNADGDAVGSVSAMRMALLRVASAQVTAMLPDGVPDELAWLPGTGELLDGQSQRAACLAAIAASDLVIGLDISSFSRTGSLADSLASAPGFKMLVDHHIGPDTMDLVISEPELSSTCELVYWLLSTTFGPDALDAEVAGCLYTGISTDTGNFAYSNTRQSLYLATASLLDYGIDPMTINRRIRNVFTLPRLRFFGHALAERLEVYPGRGVALMVLTQRELADFGVSSSELTGLINEVMKLRDIDCGILVREEHDKVRLSLRSKEEYDVNRLAGELFGGGGHQRAAGATSLLSLAETVAAVKQKLGLQP